MLLAVLLVIGATGAADLQPQHRLLLRSFAAARLNPTGLQEELTVLYRYRLYDDPRPLWDGWVGTCFNLRTNPTFTAAGISLEAQPIAVTTLRAGWLHFMYYGVLDTLQSFPSPRAEYDDQTLHEGQRGYALQGDMVFGELNLQAKVGPVMVRNQLSLERYAMPLEHGDTVYYYSNHDVLTPGHGWIVADNFDALVLRGAWVFGARYTYTDALYRPRDYAPGEPHRDPNGPTHRAGPLVLYQLGEGRLLEVPTLVLLANVWIRHRYRAGQEVSRAVPYAALGIMLPWSLAEGQ